MSTFLLFVVLGIGSGAAYAILALGVVLIQRGSGTVNFAQGAIAMFGALLFDGLVGGGTSKPVAVLIVLLAAAALGAFWHLAVMRSLRGAPVLGKVVATLGLLAALQGAALLHYGTGLRQARSILPSGVVRVNGIAFGQDRIWLLGITVIATLLLWAWYKYTLFGIATRAAAENERGIALQGFSPDLIATANWAVGCALGAFAGILIAPIVGLSITGLSLIILPGLAAALLGGFTSFGVTAAAGILIGCGQSVLGHYWNQPGTQDALPFVVVVLTLVITGQRIPARGSLSLTRQPLAPSQSLRPITWAILLVLTVVGILTLGGVYQSALTTSIITVSAALSVVIVTGFVGQTSIMPMTFAGLGGLATSKLAQDMGVPFPIPILLAALIMIPIGAALGLPALKVRGLNLAAVTMGAAVSISAVLFSNSKWTGGIEGSLVPSPVIFGYDLNATIYPDRFGIFVLIVTVVLIAAVSNLRRSGTGLRMLAVRSNERSAAISGINVPATKLGAFALSGAVAAVSGSLLSYQIGAVSFDQFDVFGSIALLTLVYIGGVSVASGAVLAGIAAQGGIFYVLLQDRISGLGDYYALASGLLLIIVVIVQPDGGVIALRQQAEMVKSHFRRGPKAAPTTPSAGVAA